VFFRQDYRIFRMGSPPAVPLVHYGTRPSPSDTKEPSKLQTTSSCPSCLKRETNGFDCGLAVLKAIQAETPDDRSNDAPATKDRPWALESYRDRIGGGGSWSCPAFACGGAFERRAAMDL